MKIEARVVLSEIVVRREFVVVVILGEERDRLYYMEGLSPLPIVLMSILNQGKAAIITEIIAWDPEVGAL